ncbi:MAG: MBOAT family protein, partial [Victivallales bacterium]|nr:MBOAT family protein [Victivallales bacterium]
WVRNVFIVFLLSGLWHGANWTFVVWGGLHGLYYLVERLGGRAWRAAGLDRLVPRLVRQPLQVLLVFSAVCLSWVFFRAASLADAMLILGRVFTRWEGGLYMGGSQLTTLLSLALIALLAVVQFLQAAGWVSLYFSRSRFPRPVRWAAYIGMILGIALLGKSSNEFIYFQF